MREAILKGSPDLASVRPRKDKLGGKAVRREASHGALRLLLQNTRSRGLAILVWSGFAIIMGGIVVNATVFQKGHHPAPLFGTAAPPAPATAKRPVGVASLVTAPADPDPAGQPAATVPPVATLPAVRADGIGLLLRGQGGGAASHPDATATVDTKSPHAAARVRPGQPRAAGTKPETPQARTADRNRLANMMSAAARPHGAPVQAN